MFSFVIDLILDFCSGTSEHIPEAVNYEISKHRASWSVITMKSTRGSRVIASRYIRRPHLSIHRDGTDTLFISV